MTAAASRPRRRLAALALVVAASLTAAGCGNVSVGAAAVADGRRVSVADLQNATAQIQDIAGPNNPVPQVQVLNWLVLEPWAVDIAAKYGVGVSDDDALQVIKKLNPAYDPASSAATHKTAAPETISAVRCSMALQALMGQTGQLDQAKAQQALTELQAKVRAAHPDVNPRYITQTPDWLVGGGTPTAGSGQGGSGQGSDQGGSGQGSGQGSGSGSGSDGTGAGSGSGQGSGTDGSGSGSGSGSGQAPQPTAS